VNETLLNRYIQYTPKTTSLLLQFSSIFSTISLVQGADMEFSQELTILSSYPRSIFFLFNSNNSTFWHIDDMVRTSGVLSRSLPYYQVIQEVFFFTLIMAVEVALKLL
jgi:hypothetical protein